MDSQSANGNLAASVLNAEGSSPVLLVCEHASNFIPVEYSQLGISDEALSSHIAFDIGALSLATKVSRLMDARLVYSCFSRLLFDCNRAVDAGDAIVEKSEIYTIPGNTDLTAEQKKERAELCYLPFSKLVKDALAKSVTDPILVTIHSFTPEYNGVRRELDIGVIHDTDARLANKIMEHADYGAPLKFRLNEPYNAADNVTHTLQQHGIKNSILNVMFEINNKLLSTESRQNQIASTLTEILTRATRPEDAQHA